MLISSFANATDIKDKHLSKLQILIDNNLTYEQGVNADSIILWEKDIEPELEKAKKFDILFQLKLLTIEAYIAQGNISLAIDNANLMYQKAREMNSPLGTALALRAIGSTYLSSSTPQEAIESYKESLKQLDKVVDADTYIKSTLTKLIITKLKNKQLGDVMADIKRFEAVCQKDTKPAANFFMPVIYAYYYIETDSPEKAMDSLKKAVDICMQYPYVNYCAIIDHLWARYYLLTKQYNKSLDKYNEMLEKIKSTDPNSIFQMQQEKAKLLILMGQEKEACDIYEKINAQKDTLSAQSYSQQINELHTLYQVDQKEMENQIKQKNIYFWILIIVIFILFLITYFIFRIRKENAHLLRSHQEQEEAKKQAENSIRTKSLFLSNMSHEIRTPLNALSGFSTILTEESIDNETRKQCNDIIQQNSELLLKLINDVIDLSNLEIGKMDFNFKDCDAVSTCRNVIDMVDKIKQTSANVRFVTSLRSLKLTTDSSRLQQVLINLLINATKFTPNGSITLELQKQAEGWALFSVTDTGCGIPKEKHGQIFNRFEKLNENAQGTGLGLSICQLIIEQLGGKIWIDSDYDQGSRFLFTHPIKSKKPRENDKTKRR